MVLISNCCCVSDQFRLLFSGQLCGVQAERRPGQQLRHALLPGELSLVSWPQYSPLIGPK